MPEVSIVVPTRNGAATLPALIEAHRVAGRRGRARADRSRLGIHRRHAGAGPGRRRPQVIEIAPSRFNHGTTRNLGIGRATGRFVVLTVQDARPLTQRLARPPAGAVAPRRRCRRRLRAPGAASRRQHAVIHDHLSKWVASQTTPRVMTLDPETFARLAPTERLDALRLRQRVLGRAALGVGGLALSGDADRRGSGVEPQRPARRARDCVRARRRRRALPRPRRAIRAGPHLGAASAAAASVRPSLGAHRWRVGAQRRLHGASASAAGRAQRACPIGSADWRRAIGLGVAWPLGQFLGGWTAASGRPHWRPRGV